VFLLLAGIPAARAEVVLSEMLAANRGGFRDGWNETPDWIELHNSGSTAVDLTGWHLTDDPSRPTRWTFPSESIGPGAYLVVFASGRNTRDPAGYLHTNFQLSTEGETVLLVRPDGLTVASRLNDPVRPQLDNVAFGRLDGGVFATLLRDDAAVRVWVPSDAGLGNEWIQPAFNDGAWSSGRNPTGFEDSPENYAALIRNDVSSLMRGRNTTCYLRQEFLVEDPASFSDWRLRIQYDDGFVAWLNGQRIGIRNAPAAPLWNSTANGNHPDADALVPSTVPISSSVVRSGRNVLAIQGMNAALGSSDFLIGTRIEARPAGGTVPETGYLTEPTPGRANGDGVAALGPLVESVIHTPTVPTATQPLVVTARIRETFAPVGEVTLTYRIQFGEEVQIPMRDDGAQGDGRAGDGIYGAAIPAGAGRPGQMIRYAVSAADLEGHSFRIPLHLDPLASEEYRGTVVADPTVSSQLPIVHLFVAPAELPRIDGEVGGRVAVFFNGELYDNVRMEVRGNTTAACNKKSHRVEFPRDHLFLPPGADLRLRRTSFMADYADPAYLRQHLSFWLAQQAGLHAPYYDPVRLQMNGTFYQLAYHSDVLGDEQLRRFELDPNGALYKAVGVAIPDGSSTGGFQKLTRTDEGTEDYVDFVTAIGPGHPLAERRVEIFDRVDLPQVINYMAVARIVQEEDDIWANMTLYRDTNGDREWRIIPFDMNLSWGQIYGSGTVQATSDSFKSHPLYGNSRNIQAGGPFGAYNRFYDAVMQVPETRDMLLRRMRTLMDRFLQPPGTSPESGLIEGHIRGMTNAFWAEAFLDRSKWGWPVGCGPYGFGANLWLTNGVTALQNQFLTPRRRHLFVTHSITNTIRTVGLANSQRAGIPLPQDPGISLSFGDLDVNPASRNQEEEYVQLVNPHDVAVDISDWTVSGAIEHAFPGGTVIPPESALYLSPAPAAFRARATGPRGGQGLFVHGPYRGQLSARGETLVLHDATGRWVAAKTYPPAPSPAQASLRITEIHYHPAPDTVGGADDEELEFVELENIGSVPVDLAGVRFVEGIAADLGALTTGPLPAGETLVVARNPAVFAARYGAGRRVVGPFSGRLDNAGERLRLVDSANEEIEDFRYEVEAFPSTDGGGFSLELLAVDLPAGSRTSWRPSRVAGGSPGAGGGVRPRIQSLRTTESGLELELVVGPDPLGTLQQSASLSPGAWTVMSGVSLPVAPGPGSIRIPLPTDSARYYRITTVVAP